MQSYKHSRLADRGETMGYMYGMNHYWVSGRMTAADLLGVNPFRVPGLYA